MDEEQNKAIAKLPGLRAALECLEKEIQTVLKDVAAGMNITNVVIPSDEILRAFLPPRPDEMPLKKVVKRTMTPEGKKKVSDAQKKRWEEVRRNKARDYPKGSHGGSKE